MLARGLNAPVTSSAGRLFDAVASLIGLRQRVSFEGQAAMELEFAIQLGMNASYPFKIRDGPPLIVDWGSAIEGIVRRRRSDPPGGEISAKFHNTLAEMVRVSPLRMGEAKIVLTGGCFQNRHLTEACLKRLLDAGFRPYWHQRVPPNDGGISLGKSLLPQERSVRELSKTNLPPHELALRRDRRLFSEHECRWEWSACGRQEKNSTRPADKSLLWR